MNILPKKSWHVRNRKNIERVQRDETEAKRLAQIEQDRKLRAENESRIAKLKSRLGADAGSDTPKQHFNLFEGHQDILQSSNPEHEQEERDREARRRFRTDIYSRLGRPKDIEQPWYCHPDKFMTRNTKPSGSSSNLVMSMYDPMTAMNQAEEIARRKRHERRQREESARDLSLTNRQDSSSPEIVGQVLARKRVKATRGKKSKKDRHKHRHHRCKNRH